jgi:hypothetical protein
LATISIDIVVCTPRDRQLAVLLGRAHRNSPWALPHSPWVTGEDVENAAIRAAARALGRRPAWLDQLGVFGNGGRRRTGAALSIGFVGVVPDGSMLQGSHAKWCSIADLPTLTTAHAAIVDAAVASLRERLDWAPVAFRLLPPTFTLAALQSIYELLLERRLHKASFRRALHAARLVMPTDAWHTDGRGRPAQLFRYAPHRRKRSGGGVRFDRLGAP